MNQAILMLSLAFLLSCSTTGKSSWPVLKDREVNTEFTLKGEELAVIETVVSTLEQSYGKDEVDGQFIASNDSIITLNVYYTYEGNLVQKTEIIRGKKENISEELIANYYAVNELEVSFSEYITHNDKLVDSAIAKSRIPNGNESREFWSNLHAVYPDAIGTLAFSRVGFSEDRTEALLEVDFKRGPMTGFRDFLLRRCHK
jgi:hypothetical protein